MIGRVIDFSVNHKTVVFAVTAFACIGGWWSTCSLALDAVPDLGDVQVIVFSRWDRSPDVIEDQVTYPIVTAMLGAPRVKTVRGISDFGYSYVYVVFQDGTDPYWARSRTMEYLSAVLPRLPEGAKTQLGPDASSLGWVFQYVLNNSSGKHTSADLRSYQDWYLRYYLQSVPGVAEVAAVGGQTRQYQVNVDPYRLRAYGIPIDSVVEAVRGGNGDSSGRLLEFGGTEYMIRGRGYARSLEDLANIPLSVSPTGSQIRIRDIGQVTMGPDVRRGVADLNGQGEVVSGIVIMRNGENALAVIDRVKAKIREIEPGLPDGMRIVPVYDRSDLIRNSIRTVRRTVIEVVVTVVLIIVIFLWHLPSAAIPIVTMPVAVLLAFLPLRYFGIDVNIMSLSGMALAFSELVDASIVVVEQTHKKLEEWNRSGRAADCRAVVMEAVKEVAGPTFFALLVIAVSFLPVITLDAQEGRMFRPLAYTKTLAMLVAAVLAITLDPALRLLLTRVHHFDFGPAWLCRLANAALLGEIRSEERHPISRPLTRVYEPVVRWSLRHRWIVIAGAVAAVAVSLPIFFGLGTEAMPPLDEGTILYMPTTAPGISIAQAADLLRITDGILARFPEVDRVLGKAGRAETATDPAPLSMLETIVILKPRVQWRRISTWYSSWAPGWTTPVLRRITPDTMSTEDLIARMDRALKLPGLSNSWSMPVRGRLDMLTTGIRTPLGLKIAGAELGQIEEIGARAAALLESIPGTRVAFAERTNQGAFLDLHWDREQLARYGIGIAEAQRVVENAIGGENVTAVVHGPERYGVNVRIKRDFRSDLAALAGIPVAAGPHQLPLSALAHIELAAGPAMIRNENGLLAGYVYLDIAGRDPATYIRDAGRVLSERLRLPAGYALEWSGQSEALERIRLRLRQVLPATLLLVGLLLYFNTGSMIKTGIVLLAVPFSAVGAIWFLYLAGYNVSVAVWVGLIALLGIDAETGVFMLLYLDLAYQQAEREGRLRNLSDLRDAIVQGAAKRLRPKFMTFATTCIGLFPMMWATGAGSDVTRRIAAPMIGGIFTSFLLELLVYPAVYEVWRWDFGLAGRLAAKPVAGPSRRGLLTTTTSAVLILLGSCATASAQELAAPGASSQPSKPAPPTITYTMGQLRIQGLDSNLSEVLFRVAALTGVKIDIPEGVKDERLPFVAFGPGSPREVLASLLRESELDYLIQGGEGNDGKLLTVMLLKREKSSSATEVAARSPRRPAGRPAPPVSAEQPAPETAPAASSGAAEAAAVVGPSPTFPLQDPNAPPSAPAAILPTDGLGSPPQQLNGQKVAPLSPPTALTPQNISQQLQHMYQQRMQINQQDRQGTSQPGSPNPEAK